MDWLNVPDVAEGLGVPVTRVRQMVRDRTLLARRVDGVLKVPAAFIQDGAVVKGLPGLLTLLFDAGYNDDEALDWLFREDPSLPGTPVQALAENRGKEVRRRAQALGF
ncbi:Rv2175c family DNA-binding protein [Frankia sp. Mgl5]|uniref:Rv2175c family DNA-binding protein n=1 Tax=Frankia sp. Mgl5 TaxID=2933793 RepID=UPI00200FE7EE|nr:Rv2175c family DNA-binding protein [Frankia sp. Mgl5]MCK9928740.1 Rv2175c family DNA-binding protein [Frankia sp. Mgl5]